MCEKYHCLPSAGGLLDQNQLVVRKLQIVSSARSKREKQEQEKREKEMKRKQARKGK